MTRSALWLIVLAALLFAGRPADAAQSATVASSRATVSIVSDTDAVAPRTPFRLGLLIRMAPGWHTYWKNPGDAGAAPDLKLSVPAGAKTGGIDWPVPRRLSEGPLTTYAYTGDLLLPMTVTPSANGSGLTVTADASWLVCKDICVPEQGTFRLDLPAGRPAPSAEAPLFEAAARDVPRPSPWETHIAPDGTLWVRGPELGAASIADAWFIPDTPGTINDAAAQPLAATEGGFALHLALGRGFKPAGGLAGILTVLDRSGQETHLAVTATPGAIPAGFLAPAGASLWRLLGLALLGGLILNLMPCVFPVLAMKAIGLASGAARGRLRADAASYTVGVLAAFAVLGGALLVARAAGAAAGWGFQFASPVFVAIMAVVLFAVGLNLSGVFQVGQRLVGTGQGLAERGGQLGSFFTGLLAVLVATPCTAPFMAAAIAGALAAPPVATMAVFLAMGFGLAAPYLAFAMVPGLGRLLPRPGRWMETLRQVLAFPMYAAAAWLMWVLSAEAGPDGLAAALAGLVLVGFAAWLLGASQTMQPPTGRLGRLAATAAAGAALAALCTIGLAPAAAPLGASANAAEAFSPARLAALRAEGRPVFVDMTAAWCVTCLVNERVAIEAASVREAFAARRVAYLKGDWTRQDPTITGFLRAHGRDGVPLYLYYPADAREPRILPQILTPGEVLAGLGAG